MDILLVPHYIFEYLVTCWSLSCLFDRNYCEFSFGGRGWGSFFFVVSWNVKWQVTQLDLHRQFHGLGAGVIEEVRIQREKGFGFVRYSNHSEAALAIQIGNGQILCGKPIKVELNYLRSFSLKWKAYFFKIFFGFDLSSIRFFWIFETT